MKSRERFESAGLVSPELPQFPNGWAQGDQLWFFDQTSVYYRRHLLLHEGTHAFMAALASGTGPPWFSEGMAELLATHRWQDGQLTLNFFPLARGRAQVGADRNRADRFRRAPGQKPRVDLRLRRRGLTSRMKPTAGAGPRRRFWTAARATRPASASCTDWPANPTLQPACRNCSPRIGRR